MLAQPPAQGLTGFHCHFPNFSNSGGRFFFLFWGLHSVAEGWVGDGQRVPFPGEAPLACTPLSAQEPPLPGGWLPFGPLPWGQG